MSGERIAPEILARFRALGIDAELTLKILDGYNEGRYGRTPPVKAAGLPAADGKTVLDLSGAFTWTIGVEEARRNLGRFDRLVLDPESFARRSGERLEFARAGLEALGVRLYPLLSYGVLNGGSATSYVDEKKNSALSPVILEICGKVFERIAADSRGRAKGLTPAFVQPDGSPGPSYLELKMRALLIQALGYRRRALPNPRLALHPLFQMTSVTNDREIGQALRGYRSSPMLSGLIEATGIDACGVLTGVQPLIAAFTHSENGFPKRIFTDAFRRKGEVLPLPGGHGQNFAILKGVYRELLDSGKRFIQLGNVDNLGNTPDPAELALLALSGKRAGFDFAHKTPVDVKGGVLVVDPGGRLECVDIGPAISSEEVARLESAGGSVLFNCATGLFDLERLVGSIDAIVETLPVRFSDQDKDAGRYSQAEQITWEVIGMLDDVFIFGVDKYERFLAAKLLLECLMTSGIGLDNPGYPTDARPERDLKLVASRLHAGLRRKLETVYGMREKAGRWEPRGVEELVY